MAERVSASRGSAIATDRTPPSKWRGKVDEALQETVAQKVGLDGNRWILAVEEPHVDLLAQDREHVPLGHKTQIDQNLTDTIRAFFLQG